MAAKQHHAKRNVISTCIALGIALLSLFIQNRGNTDWKNEQLEAKRGTNFLNISVQ